MGGRALLLPLPALGAAEKRGEGGDKRALRAPLPPEPPSAAKGGTLSAAPLPPLLLPLPLPLPLLLPLLPPKLLVLAPPSLAAPAASSECDGGGEALGARSPFRSAMPTFAEEAWPLPPPLVLEDSAGRGGDSLSASGG